MDFKPKKIRAQYATGFNDSPIELSNSELKVIRDNGCECWNCGLTIFEMDDYPSIRDKKVYCVSCENNEFYETCPICEDYYEKPQLPTDHFFVVSKEHEKEIGMKAGFYGVLRFPVYRAAVAFGFESMYQENTVLLRECDINSMYRKINTFSTKDIGVDFCCSDCKDKYCGIVPVTRYTYKSENKRINAIIKMGA